MTNLLQFAIYKYIYMFEYSTVNFNAFCNARAKIAFFPSEMIFTFLYAGSSTQNVSEQFVLCIHLSFVL